MGVLELKPAPEHVVTVFGSSRPLEGQPEYVLAHDVGKELAEAAFAICNGGYGGIMEASARGAKSAGGKTLGVVTEYFSTKANAWIDTVITKKSLTDRMLELISRGEAYVILKGGTGTLLEFAAVWEFMNKSVITEKPIVVVGGFWTSVIETLRKELSWEGREDCTKYVSIVESAAACVSLIKKELSRKAHGK